MFPKPQYQYLSRFNSSNYSQAVECQNGWVYDNSTFKSTIATEWDLVCSRKGMNKATATFFFVGVMCGAPLFGYLSDRFFTGMSLAGISIISIVLNVEWFGIEHRTFSGIIISLDWTIGNWLLVLMAYLVTEWRTLILVVSSPLLLAVIAWRWLPESARWLMANGKTDEAYYYLKKCAEMNNRAKCLSTLTPEALLEVAETRDKKYTIINLFKTPGIRKLSICSGIMWFGVAFTYYGISLNITGFGLNPYLTQFIFASIEMPMKIGVYYFLEKIGRKPGQILALLATGLCLFINIFITQDKWLVRTVVGVLGKAMSEAAFTIAYLYTTEIYPTVVRQNGLGYTSFMARMGVSISPLIMLLEDVWQLLPSIIYCAVAITAGLVTFFLRETLNQRLPQYIEDIETPSGKSAEEN
uniref:Uncharacterized protein n=1 Tax=Knipowitschia caucasica TaxID=637954 RepID=A0AAV2LGP7_KNICA